MHWARTTAKTIRTNLKAAQKRGNIPAHYGISARSRTASMLLAVDIYITGLDTVLRDDDDPIRELTIWSTEAIRVSAEVHDLIADQLAETDSNMRFIDLTLNRIGVADMRGLRDRAAVAAEAT